MRRRRVGSKVAAKVPATLVGAVFLALALGACGEDRPAPPIGSSAVTIAGLVAVEAGHGDRWIVMLHGRTTHKEAFFPLFPALVASDEHVLAIDYNPSDGGLPRTFDRLFTVLRHRGATEIVLVGSSLGSGYALRASARCCDAVVTFSAVEVVDTLLPVLAVASRADGETAMIARRIAVRSPDGTAVIVSGGTHGVDLIRDHPEIAVRLTRWIDAQAG